MRIRAQVGMVMNLDKCIGCHTCSVTCKTVWTNRAGAEYMWFNDVETKPGSGYPKRWEDQERWRGGWELDRKGRLRLKAGGKLAQAHAHLLQPRPARARRLLRALDLRLPEPDQRSGLRAPADGATRSRRSPASRSTSAGDRTGRTTSPAAPTAARLDPNLRGIEEQVQLDYERAFMLYLPRICEHCLNPSCVASCPSGAMYKREEDGIVLVDQDKCRGWRMCVSGCPYKKVYFNWQTGKAEKCTLCYPRMEAGHADDLLGDLRRQDPLPRRRPVRR